MWMPISEADWMKTNLLAMSCVRLSFCLHVCLFVCFVNFVCLAVFYKLRLLLLTASTEGLILLSDDTPIHTYLFNIGLNMCITRFSLF